MDTSLRDFSALGTAKWAAHCWRMDPGKSRLFFSMHRASACQDSKMRTKCSNPNGLASTFPFHWLTNKNTRKKKMILTSTYNRILTLGLTGFNSKNVWNGWWYLRKTEQTDFSENLRRHISRMLMCPTGAKQMQTSAVLPVFFTFKLQIPASKHMLSNFALDISRDFSLIVFTVQTLLCDCFSRENSARQRASCSWKEQTAFKLQGISNHS